MAVIQSAIVSRLPLFSGTADIMLVVLVAIALQRSGNTAWQWSVVGGLFVDYLSGLPFGIFTISYLLATGVALVIRDRIWRYSFLMQLLVVLFGTVFVHLLSFIVLYLQGSTISFGEALQLVTLPSIILNFMLSFPIYILIQDVLDQFITQE
jgi:rod shape-determining protein MreD